MERVIAMDLPSEKEIIIFEVPSVNRLIIEINEECGGEIIVVQEADPKKLLKNKSENLNILRTLRALLPANIADQELPQESEMLTKGLSLSASKLREILKKVNAEISAGDFDTESTDTGYSQFTTNSLGKRD